MCCYRSRLVFSCCFEDNDISQGSVATYLRCGGIFNDSIITNADFDTEISLKIRQYLTKLRRTKQSVPVFCGHLVYCVGWGVKLYSLYLNPRHHFATVLGLAG